MDHIVVCEMCEAFIIYSIGLKLYKNPLGNECIICITGSFTNVDWICRMGINKSCSNEQWSLTSNAVHPDAGRCFPITCRRVSFTSSQ